MSKRRLTASQHDQQMRDYLRLWNNPTEKNAKRYRKWLAHHTHDRVDFSLEAMVIGVHKARVAAHEDPEARLESVGWLTERGYSLDIQ